jgi:hypothetical protein
MGRRALVAAAIVATASFAHAPVKTRALRLQLEGGRLQGLLTYHVPAAAALAYQAAADPGVALAPAALQGLRLEADGAPAAIKVADASVRRGRDGSLDASFLLEPVPVTRALRVGVESGPPLPVSVIAQTGVRLTLQEGPGAPIAGGLSLRPRPGLSCLVAIRGAATGTPR